MKLSDKLKARRVELSTTMQTMVDGLATENRDFSAEERSRFDGLKSEKEALTTRIADAEAAEEGERREEGREIHEHRQLGEGEVRALRPEQRMADLVSWEGPRPDTGRVLRGMLLGNWENAEIERRAQGEGTGSLGGFLVNSATSAMLIDKARNASVVIAAGGLTVPMESAEKKIVTVLTDPTPMFRKEHQEITESGMTFGPKILRAKLLGCLCRFSVELLEDAPEASSIVENVMGAAIGLELDRAGLFGNGADEPLGLYNTDGVNVVSMGTNGGTPSDFDAYLDAIAAIENANGVPGAIVMSPRSRRTLAGLKTGIASDKTPLTPPADYTALKRFASNQIPTNLTQGSATTCSTSFVGDFSQMGIAVRTGLTVEATRTGGTGTFAKAEVLVRAYVRADIVVMRPAFFTRIVGIKA